MVQATLPQVTTNNSIVNQQINELDSGNLMRSAFHGELDAQIPASDILLAWILRIPTKVDPAKAAKLILEHYAVTCDLQVSKTRKDLVVLLKQLSQYDAGRMGLVTRTRRKRKASRSYKLHS